MTTRDPLKPHLTDRSLLTLRMLIVAFVMAAMTAGCTKIRYAGYIDAVPGSEDLKAARPFIEVDAQASYLEVSSDSERRPPSARFDRQEILTALASAWNRGLDPERSEPARVVIIGAIEHEAGDVAGTIIHSTLGVTYVLGLPHSCGYSTVGLVVQTQSGRTWHARGHGTDCSGLYYPQDHRMTSLAAGINDAIDRLEPVTAAELLRREPRVREIAAPFSAAATLLADRVIWRVQPTTRFAVPWGVESAPGGGGPSASP